MTKAEARKSAKAKISLMSEPEKEWASGAIVDELCALDDFKKAHNIFIFLSTDLEPNTEEIVGLSLALEKNVSVPRLDGDNMQAVCISPYTNFKRNIWDILEPIGGQLACEIDLCILPLAAFDGLNRVGHGKGFYDKFLAEHQCKKIGIAFDCQEVCDIQMQTFDVPLDMLVTEKRMITKDGKHIANVFLGEI